VNLEEDRPSKITSRPSKIVLDIVI
jgi:hypothetical protein